MSRWARCGLRSNHVTVKTIGFVGTGAITEAMVRGLLTEP
ncbi:pyrroline-5-carboxylate reductase, partial [Rhizobium ruizarguesonis]